MHEGESQFKPDEDFSVESKELGEKNSGDESYCPTELLERFEGLANGEVVELPNYAVIAIDIERYSEFQNSGPEIAQEISELNLAYRNKMVDLASDPKYGDMLFVKSAGDELLFIHDYQDIGDFLRLALFTVESQIAFNELLNNDEFENLKTRYAATNSRNTQYIQPGICIPTVKQKHNLALKLADVGDKKELVVVGNALIAKKWARQFYSEAQFGVVEDNGFSRHDTFTNVLQDVAKTYFPPVEEDDFPNINLDILSSQSISIEDLRTLGRQLELRIARHPRPSAIKHEVSQEVINSISRKIAPEADIQISSEVIRDQGEVAFVNTTSIDISRYLLEREIMHSSLGRAVQSKLVTEFVAEAVTLTTNEVMINLGEGDWLLKETEWLASVPPQLEDQNENEPKFSADGSLVLVATRGILKETTGESSKGMHSLAEAFKYLQSAQYREKLGTLISSLSVKHGAEGIVDVARIITALTNYSEGFGTNIGYASLEEDGVYAYCNDVREVGNYVGSINIGGNVLSLAARRAFSSIEDGSSITIAPELATNLDLAIDTKAETKTKSLKGFPGKSDLLLLRPN